MRGTALALAAAALAAGCVTRRVDPIEPPAAPPAEAPDPGDPVEAMANLDLRIECDRVRVQVPERLRGDLRDVQKCNVPPFLVTVRRMAVVIREAFPVVEVGGEDFSVVAEGGVRTVRREGGSVVEAGPFHTLVLRNGRILTR